jgi:hypothetical protein
MFSGLAEQNRELSSFVFNMFSGLGTYWHYVRAGQLPAAFWSTIAEVSRRGSHIQ